jgi:hypothetical protein
VQPVIVLTRSILMIDGAEMSGNCIPRFYIASDEASFNNFLMLWIGAARGCAAHRTAASVCMFITFVCVPCELARTVLRKIRNSKVPRVPIERGGERGSGCLSDPLFQRPPLLHHPPPPLAFDPSASAAARARP